MRKFQTRNQVQGLELRDRAKETCPTAAPAQDGGLDQQAKENVARLMFDVAKLALRISSLESGYRTLRYELTSINSAQQHQ